MQEKIIKKALLIGCLMLCVLVMAAGCNKSSGNPTMENEGETTEKTTEKTTEETTEEATALEKYDYVIDYHKLAPLYEQVYSSVEVEAAHKIIDAYLNGETEVHVSEMRRTEIESTESLLRVMCPTIMAMVEVSVPSDYETSTTTISWNYRRPIEEVKTEIERFEAEVSKYLDELYECDSKEMRALIIYMMFSEATQYDYTLSEDEFGGLSEDEVAYRNTAYWAIVGHTGVCYSYSEALTFLYNQAGIDAYTIANFDGAHEWTMAELDGKYYYMDATWSGSGYGYYDLTYFGLTTEDRETWAGGFSREANVLNFIPVSEFCKVDDKKYADLHDGNFCDVSIKNIDHMNQTIELQLNDGRTYLFGQ